MTDKGKAELLAGAYQRQYHHNDYPELSDNSEFVTSKEEIKEACMYMAQWKDKEWRERAQTTFCMVKGCIGKCGTGLCDERILFDELINK